MRPFNLSSYLAEKRVANLVPNGTSGVVPDAAPQEGGSGGSWVPNGSGLGQGVQITEGAEESDKKPIADIIGNILRAAKSSDSQELQLAAEQALNAEIPPQFLGNQNVMNLITAIGKRADEDPDLRSRNLETGESESSLDELAKELAGYLGLDPAELERKSATNETEQSSQPEGADMASGNQNPVATGVGSVPSVRLSAAGDEAVKERDRQKDDPTHKRKKSNPFRVLMGYVGKLRDHGMSKREIVQKILHMKGNRWDSDTIRKCVDIVTERNRRKKKQETTDMSMGTLENKMFAPAFNLSKWERTAKAPKGMDGDFEDRKSVYDQERDPRLMSVTELLIEFIYMVSAKEFIPGAAENNGMGANPDKKGIKRRLGMLRQELKRRGYESNEIIDLLDVTSGEGEEEEQEG